VPDFDGDYVGSDSLALIRWRVKIFTRKTGVWATQDLLSLYFWARRQE
jgi:hypothetical protein